MKIRGIKAKSIVTKSNLPDSDYVVNPYVGLLAKYERVCLTKNNYWRDVEKGKQGIWG